MQARYFSPSINIIRDQNTDLSYLPTRNGEIAFNKITSAFLHGSKSFNIVGAYGTGKSAFILAFEKVLNGKAKYFINPLNGNVKQFDNKYIVGEYNSLKKVFCKHFGFQESIDPIDQFRSLISEKSKKDEGLLVVIDEFGKFLEFAAKESPDEEMYFIQQLAEIVNSPDQNIFFITTLHQAFDDYALSLNKTQKKEWEKVRGRLVEITFNEPVEQLLFLASERIEQKSIINKIPIDKQKELFEAIDKANSFPMRDYFTFKFAKKLFPFDLLSGSVITLAFQAYGQNERSLFSFLESQDYLGLNDFSNGSKYYHLGNIYDYLVYNFHSLLNSRFNPHAVQWRSINEAIQRVESNFENDINGALCIIKTIGLLSIFGRKGQYITSEFLKSYGEIALEIDNVESIIKKLEQKQIIRYRNYSKKYVLFKGTDFDILTELDQAEEVISKDFSFINELRKNVNFPIYQAKKSFYKTGTPRYFEFLITEQPINKEPEGSIDGYINLIINPLLNKKDIKKHSEKEDKAILYGLVRNSHFLKEQLIEIEKIRFVAEKCKDDEVASSELNDQLKNAKESLNQLIVSSFYGNNSMISWFSNGVEHKLDSSRDLNSLLSKICKITYYSTPIFKNELINRERIPASISTAKNKLIIQLLNNGEAENIGFEADKFPPEKTIYLSLLKSTGIHRIVNDLWCYTHPLSQSFNDLWNISEKFLEECAVVPRKVSDLIEIIKQKPFKLKSGFIEFWVPIFLIAKNRSYALYEKGIFIPELTSDTLEVIMKQPQKYYINTFALDDTKLKVFNQYRYFLNQVEINNPGTDTFVETIKPFLTFYRRLPYYSQNTKKLNNKALRLRTVITNTGDPKKMFFEEIPRALGFSVSDLSDSHKLEQFTVELHNTTREISGAYSDLINRLEKYINTTLNTNNISFPENKLSLQKRFKKVKQEHLKIKLKVLVQRINTPLDDRQSWLSSIATAILNKTPDKFSDEDELAFKNLFPQAIHDLDNLTDISKKDIDIEKEDVLKLELTSFVKGVQKHLIRLPKEKSKHIEQKKEKIKGMLDNKDKQANITLLLKLLQEEIGDE